MQAAQSLVIVVLPPSGRKDRERGRPGKEEEEREERYKNFDFFFLNVLVFSLVEVDMTMTRYRRWIR